MIRSVLPPTAQRVRLHTKEGINKRIHEKTQMNIAYYKTRSREEIITRIEELDNEWDIERALETNAAIIILLSVFLSLFTNQMGWIIFIGIISAFLLQHALQGWCPPIPIFRRMGIRTSSEIDQEKYCLKNLIGYHLDKC